MTLKRQAEKLADISACLMQYVGSSCMNLNKNKSGDREELTHKITVS